MYRHDDEDSYVVLGLPCKKPHQAKKNGLESWESAKSSKVGGYAVNKHKTQFGLNTLIVIL